MMGGWLYDREMYHYLALMEAIVILTIADLPDLQVLFTAVTGL